MGDPRRMKNKYKWYKKRWDKERILRNWELRKKYGLKRVKEILIAEAFLRKLRRQARELLAVKDEEKERILLQTVYNWGLLKENATLDDILSLTVEDVLERRLQTLVFRKGLAKTIKEARQLITHGHIALKGRKVTSPSMLLKRGEEDFLDYYYFNPNKRIIEEKEVENVKE